MPIISGNRKLENISHIEAQKRGYMRAKDAQTQAQWISENFEVRHNTTFVYVNGKYLGTSKKDESLYKIVEKFKL